MFIEHNENPYGANIDDCVIRAITFALNIDYWDVFDELCNINDTIYPNLNINSFPVFDMYLKRHGLECREFNTKLTVKQFSDGFDEGIVLVLVNGHMTVVKDGNIYDTWNPSRYKCQFCWVVK